MEYQIGDFSRISRLSIKTLRYYHEEGILIPSSIDPENGYRFYDAALLEQAKAIEELRTLDFSIKEIREILANFNDEMQLKPFLIRKAQEIEAKVLHYEEIQKRLNLAVKQGEEVLVTSIRNEIVPKKLPDLQIAFVRFMGKYQEISMQIGKLMAACGRFVNGPLFALYYDADYKEEDADIAICAPVRQTVSHGEVSCRILEGGSALTFLHHGPYENIGASYKVVIDYFNQTQTRIILPYREVYLKGPGLILPRNPKNFITEIQLMTG